jgi:hypothetical protein
VKVGEILRDQTRFHREDTKKQCSGREFRVTRVDLNRIDLEGAGGTEVTCTTCGSEFAVVDGKIQVNPLEDAL